MKALKQNCKKTIIEVVKTLPSEIPLDQLNDTLKAIWIKINCGTRIYSHDELSIIAKRQLNILHNRLTTNDYEEEAEVIISDLRKKSEAAVARAEKMNITNGNIPLLPIIGQDILEISNSIKLVRNLEPLYYNDPNEYNERYPKPWEDKILKNCYWLIGVDDGLRYQFFSLLTKKEIKKIRCMKHTRGKDRCDNCLTANELVYLAIFKNFTPVLKAMPMPMLKYEPELQACGSWPMMALKHNRNVKQKKLFFSVFHGIEDKCLSATCQLRILGE